MTRNNLLIIVTVKAFVFFSSAQGISLKVKLIIVSTKTFAKIFNGICAKKKKKAQRSHEKSRDQAGTADMNKCHPSLAPRLL